MQAGELPVFFILGRPRTGTTLLQSLFDAHPAVQIPWECQFVLNLYPRYGSVKHWTVENLKAFYSDLLQQWQFSAWNIDREKLYAELLQCKGSNTYRWVCEVVYLNYISFYQKSEIAWLGDKNHGYTIYTDRLLKIYPEAKFIYVQRDYRDNFLSIRNVDFELPFVSLVVYKWKYFYRQALRASVKHPGRFYFIRYEDLAREPHKYFNEICAFVGIEYLPEVFEFYRMKEKACEVYPTEILEKHHKSLFNPINTSRLGLWETQLSESQVRQADYVAGSLAEKAGYTRKFTTFNLWIALLAQPGIIYARTLYLATRIIDRFPYRLREKLLSKAPLWIAVKIARLTGRGR